MMNREATVSQKLYLSLYLFLVVFTPDLVPFSMRYLMTIITVILLAIELLKNKRLVMSSCQKQAVWYFIPFFVYLFIAESVHIFEDSIHIDEYISTFTNTFFSFLSAILIGIYIVNYIYSNRFTTQDLITSILLMMTMQLACVVLALVSPSIRTLFNELTINNGRSDKVLTLMESIENNNIFTRGYGLSNNLFDSFGYIVALLITICLNVGLRFNNARITALSLISLVMPLVNARTGVLLAALGIAITILYKFTRNIKSTSIAIVTILSFMLILPSVLQLLPKSMLTYLGEGISEIRSLRSGEIEGTFGVILGRDLLWPENIVFGAGAAPKLMVGHGVDNGYVNSIWSFGIVGTLIFMACFLRTFYSYATKDYSSQWNPLPLCIAVIFLTYLVKLYSLNNFGGNAIVLGLLPVLFSTNGLRSEIELPDSHPS